MKFKAIPGAGNTYVICDVCGKKKRRQDTVRVQDKWSSQNSLVVCLDDLDVTNPQAIPFKIREKIVHASEGLRPESPDSYVVNALDSRAPSAPRNLTAITDTLNPYVMLYWDGPEDVGTSQIIGYIVERANPQLGTYEVLTSNTGTNVTTYVDTTADISLEYTYRIKAINSSGSSPYSNEAFFPVINVPWQDLNYLVLSQDGSALTTGSGLPIRVNHTEAGIL